MEKTKRRIEIQTNTTRAYASRKESRSKVMRDVVSSAESATRFLKSVGVLNSSGNLSKDYKLKR